jgi:hypothetical protein
MSGTGHERMCSSGQWMTAEHTAPDRYRMGERRGFVPEPDIIADDCRSPKAPRRISVFRRKFHKTVLNKQLQNQPDRTIAVRRAKDTFDENSAGSHRSHRRNNHR